MSVPVAEIAQAPIRSQNSKGSDDEVEGSVKTSIRFCACVGLLVFLNCVAFPLAHAEPTAEAWASRIYGLAEKGQYTAALAIAQRALATYPEDPELWYLLGLAKEYTGDPAGAAIALRKSIDKRCTPVAAFELASIYRNSNRKNEAIRVLESAAQAYPDTPQIHTQLGQLYRDVTNFRDAAAHLKESLRLAPDQPEVWSTLLDVLVFLGDVSSASNELARWESAIGEDLFASFWKGRLALLHGEAEAAVSLMQPALRELPKPPSVWHLYFGQALAAADRLEEARAELEKAVVLKPDANGIYFPLGQVCRRLRDATAAHEALLIHQLLRGDRTTDWEKVPEQHPAYPFIRERLASEALEAGDAAGAIQHATAALALLPHLLQASITLGEAYEQTDDPAGALAVMLPLEGSLGADSEYQLLLARLYDALGSEPEADARRALAQELAPNRFQASSTPPAKVEIR